MAVTETEKDLAEQWLDTGGIPIPGLGGVKTYPKRSELRRAEARAAARRSAHSRPAGGRPSGAPAGRSRPPVLTGAPRSRPTLSEQYSVPLAPTPAVLPIPRTDPWRPAGIDLPLSAAPSDAFHQPETPAVPIAWGLDLTSSEPAELAEPSPRRRFGRVSGTAGRLLVMALVVGAEGVAVAQFAGPTIPADANSASFSLTDVQKDAQKSAQEQAAQEREVRIVEGQQQAAAARTAEVNKEVKAAAPAKAAAATSQYQAALARQHRAEAKAAREAKEARQLKRAREAEAAREAKAAAASQASKTSKTTASKAQAPAAKKTTSSGGSSSSGSSSSATNPANARKNPKAAAKVLLADRGWSSAQFTCLDSLWTRESGWNYQATNPSSGAYGIPQALPGNKMGASGSDWKTNPVTQMRWGLDYIADRYGNPCGAWSHSESVGWY